MQDTKELLLDTKELLVFIRLAGTNSRIKVNRSSVDFLSDKISQASCQNSVKSFAELLIKLLDSDISKLVSSIESVSKIKSKKPLLWIRTYPKIAAALCFVSNDELYDTLEEIEFDIEEEGYCYPCKPKYDIGIKATAITGISHGSDIKCGNSILFRRCCVVCNNKKTRCLPFVSGNSIRGIVRNLLADNFLTLIDIEPNRNNSRLALWFFHALYSGGTLNEKQDKQTKALDKALGDYGSCRSEGTREFKRNVPVLSSLGFAAGNRIIPGGAGARFCIWTPECFEWGFDTDVKVDSLLNFEFLTRCEDNEAHTDNKAMIATTEILKAGTVLYGGVDLNSYSWNIDKAVIVHGLNLLKSYGYIGAKKRHGLGKVEIEIELNSLKGTPEDYSDEYVSYVLENKDKILKYLETIKAVDAHNIFDSEAPCKQSDDT